MTQMETKWVYGVFACAMFDDLVFGNKMSEQCTLNWTEMKFDDNNDDVLFEPDR